MAGRPIDEKIVAMKMDNSDFKRKAVETTSLFGKLRDSLNKIPGVNLGKISNDLSGIQRSANGVDMGGLARSVEAISGRFSNLGVIATTALMNITNRAVDAGMRITNSLGMEQVTKGFSEYELKIGSMGTVLSNTEWAGTGLKDVNKTFQELNEYADQTIYNFAQMTQNIGRFTAAGVTLEDSATAIKGLGNLAAISGSNTEQLNTAMYQMSQALSSGKLNLMDWNSLINAGMGGKKTQDALLATAKAMGINVDMSEGFRNSISDGWLTSQVFLETLKQFGEDESMTEAATKVRTFTQMIDTLQEGIGSGWATTWELVFGDFEEATRLWTALSNVVGGIFQKQGDARNDFLRSIINGGALTNLITGVKNVATPLIQIFKAIGDGFRVAFPPVGISGITSFLEMFQYLTKNMTLSANTVENIKIVFAGFFSVFAIGWDIIKSAVSIILALIPSFEGLGTKVLELIAKVASIPIAFNKANESGESFGSALDGLKTIASGVSSALEFIVGGLITLADTTAMAFGVLSKGEVSDGPWKDTKIVDWLLGIREGFSSFSSAIGSINWSAIGSGIVDFFGSIRSGFEWIIEKASAVGSAIRNAIPDGNQLLQGGFIAGMVAMVGMAVKMAWDLYEVFTGWGKIGAGVSETLEGVGGALESFAWQVKAQALLTIAIAVGVLAGSFYVLSKLKSEDIVKGLYAIVGGLTAIVTAMAIMTKYDITGTGLGAAVQIVALSIALAILAGAIKKMSGLNWEELSKGIVGLIGVMGTFSLAMIAMSKFSGPGVAASALQFVGLAVAMHILVSAIEKIGDINPGVIIKGVTTLAAILVSLGVFLAISSKSKFGAASAVGILGIAAAIMLIVNSVRGLGEMDVEVLKQGLITITLILAAISAFSLLSANLLAAGVGITFLAVAMNLLMVPILGLGNMDMTTLAKGLGAMAIALVAIGAASILMTGMIAAGAGLILVATGLNILLVPILALSALPLKALAIGIGGLAAGILLIGGAAALLGLAGPALLLGAAGIAALGIAMLAAGAGISLFGAGLVTLAGMTGTAVTTMVAMMGTLVMGMVSLIPAFVDFIGKLGIKILDAIEHYAPIVINKVYDIMIKVLEVLAQRVPEFAKAATDLMVAFMDSMAEQLPRIVESASNLMVATIEALANAVETNGPRFTAAFYSLMAEVAIIMVEAGIVMINALFGWIPGVQDATNEIATTAEAYIRDTFDAQGIGHDKGDDFTSALASKTGDARVAGVSVGKNAESGANSADLSSIGNKHGVDFTTALASQTGSATTSGTALATAGQTGAGSIDLTSTGINAGLGFAGGIDSKEVISNVISAATNIASAAYNKIKDVLGIQSPARETDELGQHTGQGYANGIDKKKKATEQSANSIAGVIMNALGVKSEPVRQSSKGGQAAGTNFAKGIESTKKKSSKAAKGVGKTAGKDAASEANKAFREAMEVADHKFEMGTINSEQYIAELEKIKKEYSKYPQHVRDVESKVKKIREDSAKEKFANEKKVIDDGKYYNTLSLEQELASWVAIQKKYKVGTEERKEADREVYRLKNDIVKQGFANEKKVIDDRKYYNEMSLYEEFTAWQDIQKKYKVGTEERMEADREVYRLKNELINHSFSEEKKLIDNRKYYNELSLTEELRAWERVQQNYEKGTEARKEADREVYRLKNELNKKLIDINKEYVDRVSDANKQLIEDEKSALEERDKLIKDATDKRISEEKRLTDAYNTELKNQTNSLTNFVGIFDQVTSKEISGTQLLDNMRGQFETLTNWTENFKKLSGRGLDEELLKTLRGMGPKSADEIAALNTLTDEQLLEYSNIWKAKSETARIEATDQLEELRTNTYAQIQQLQIDTNNQLQQINNDYYSKIESLRAQTAVQLETYKTEWIAKIEELRVGTEGEFVKLETSMSQIGADSVKGLIEGMKAMEGPLMAQAQAIASIVSGTIKNTLKIKSPSKVTTADGEDTGQGFANGLANKAKAVANGAKALAMAAKDSLNDFIDGFQLPEDDNELHFKAVVDYEPVDVNRFGKLNLIPDTSFTTNSAQAARALKRQNDDNIRKGYDPKPTVIEKKVDIKQELNFHSRELSPAETARKNIQASRDLALELGR